MNAFGSSHIIAVRNSAATAAHFIDVLGFSRSSLDLGTGWRVVEFGACTVCVGECGDNDDFIEPKNVPYHRWFAYVVVDDPAGLLEEMRGRGATISKELTEEEGETNFGVETPDGHQVMFGTGR